MLWTADLRWGVTAAERLIMASPCCGCEFEQIVDGADHRPLGFDLVEATQEELAEASGMLDLAEHGFDDLFSQAVAAAPAGELELSGHRGFARSFWPSSRAGGIGLAVARAAGSQIGSDPTAGEMSEIVLVTIAGVCG